jgi:hypothetical protein
LALRIWRILDFRSIRFKSANSGGEVKLQKS